MVRPSQRKEMADWAVRYRSVSIALACRAFSISETCYRYQPKLSDEKPLAIRADNGPEYVSAKLQNWAETAGIGLIYIQPGKMQRLQKSEWRDLHSKKVVFRFQARLPIKRVWSE